MNEKNWKEKVFVLLKKFRISNSVLWQIYKPFSRILNFIKYGDLYFFRSVAIEISTSCNRTCYYCPNQLNGTPTVADMFSVPVNMTINIQIPAITDPVFGTVIFPATPLDIPAFAAQTYDLFITGATSIKSIDFRSEIYPNPSNSDFTIEVNSPMNLIIYNNLGQRVFSEKIRNNIKINKSEIGSGIFIVEISDNNSVEKHKLIIN